MTVKELRDKLEGVADDTEIFIVDDPDEGELPVDEIDVFNDRIVLYTEDPE